MDWARCSPCNGRKLQMGKDEWILKAIEAIFGIIGGFCKWIIKAVFRFM